MANKHQTLETLTLLKVNKKMIDDNVINLEVVDEDVLENEGEGANEGIEGGNEGIEVGSSR